MMPHGQQLTPLQPRQQDTTWVQQQIRAMLRPGMRQLTGRQKQKAAQRQGKSQHQQAGYKKNAAATSSSMFQLAMQHTVLLKAVAIALAAASSSSSVAAAAVGRSRAGSALQQARWMQKVELVQGKQGCGEQA